MPFPMILADANCSNMNTLLTGCFSNTSQHDYQKSVKAGLRAKLCGNPASPLRCAGF